MILRTTDDFELFRIVELPIMKGIRLWVRT